MNKDTRPYQLPINLDVLQQTEAARKMRASVQRDPHRPRFHLMPPEGFMKDVNGAIFWKGRYHISMLSMMPVAAPDCPRGTNWRGRVWLHASSPDLLHWVNHPPMLESDPGQTNPNYRGPMSGDAIENAPVPTLIYHHQPFGTNIAQAEDDLLERWRLLDERAVIPKNDVHEEVKVMDSCAWYRDGKYYALTGNKHLRPGFEGDCTSLFTSVDLRNWTYQGPFYRPNRNWTTEQDDCACQDFFPLGNRFMLIMHTHKPTPFVQYYLGRMEGDNFVPENHGRMSWPGGSLAGPETMLDGTGRRLFFAWVPEGPGGSDYWKNETNWSGLVSLPRLLSLAEDGSLRIHPVPELEALRYNPRHIEARPLTTGVWQGLPDIQGDCMEIDAEFAIGESKAVGIAVRCSPDDEEHVRIMYDLSEGVIRISSRTNGPVGAFLANQQEAPFTTMGETVRFRIFVDQSVIEVFADDRQCLTQRAYPSHPDSLGLRVFSSGGSDSKLLRLQAWDMMPTAAI